MKIKSHSNNNELMSRLFQQSQMLGLLFSSKKLTFKDDFHWFYLSSSVYLSTKPVTTAYNVSVGIFPKSGVHDHDHDGYGT